MRLFGLFGNEREDDLNEQPGMQPQAHPQLPFAQKILIVVDGSQSSYDALDFALAMASRIPSCELSAAFVIDTASMDVLLQMHIFVNEERSSFENELELKGRRTLDWVRTHASKYGIDINTFLLKGRVCQVILQSVRELNIGILVVGGWHDGATRKDTSSVERQMLLDQADCPVIVVKHRDPPKKG